MNTVLIAIWLAAAASTLGYLIARRRFGRQLAAVRHQATHDPLTGIANRTGLYDQADTLIATAHQIGCPVAVAVVDLVGFKAVNDTHGHQAGDHILTVIADRLTALAGPAGLAARLGGDEFALITAPGATEPATEPAAWLTDAHTYLTAPVTYHGRQLAVGATIGAFLGNHRQTAKVWLHQADLAMYQARAERHTTCLYRDPRRVHVPVRPANRVREQARPTSRLATSPNRRTAA
ncbi:GGDEF domain-containing protein [Actinoplanes sp. NPDC051633]|uniref:GGDEF domain-containing protein n=1 Tax=Actinoplanes sp. NPDC051633 TaxID=3155670 RepID=UPI00343B987A